MMKLAANTLTIFFATTFMTTAAEMTIRRVTEEPGFKETILRLDGEIEAGDAGRILSLAGAQNLENKDWDRVIVELNSPGGSYPEGLELAKTFRRKGFATLVATGDVCYSACAIAFLGGAATLRDVEDTHSDELPTQPPERTLAAGAKLGFHAPFLNVPKSEYTAKNVQEAYRLAIDSVSMLISLADQLYVEPAELPRLLAPESGETFLVDSVDALRTLWITFSDRSFQTRDLKSITKSMVKSACINRWYHGKKRTALPGYASAETVASDFEMGSRLLSNGETGMSFGVKRTIRGVASGWIAFLPIAMSNDGKNFVWCVFVPDTSNPSVLYREAGTVEELFDPIKENWNLWEFRDAAGVMLPADVSNIEQGLRVLDMVPADTKLSDVASTIRAFQTTEPSLPSLPAPPAP